MPFAVSVFTALSVAELIVWIKPLWRYRVWLAAFFIFSLSATAVWLIVSEFSFLSALLLALAAYDILNLGRVVMNRMRDQYLRNTSFNSALWLVGLELAVIGCWWLSRVATLPFGTFWIAVLLLQLSIALLLLGVTLWHIYKTRPPVLSDEPAKLPSLTVAIPARNETEQLQKCLELLIASDYPKLEILVLDDCSQNRRTPEIIRSFAHDGVRFIAGTPADDSWLPKNHAYQQLLETANGEIIVFCGVDARFEPHSLRQLVRTMQYKKKSMLSIMPLNVLPRHAQTDAMFVQPMRYAWEIALPRKLFRRPPVLSTCWIIKKSLLTSAGGFKGVSRSIVPESYFARTAVVHDGFSFMQSSRELGISCNKQIAEQHDTATRTKYPQLHRRPELVALLTLGELLILILPIAFLLASFSVPELRLFGTVSAATSIILIVWYSVIVSLTYRRFVLRSLLAMPFAVMHDIAILNYSMLKYEFSTVYWKGRNVCIPVMRVEPKLPAMPPKPSKA